MNKPDSLVAGTVSKNPVNMQPSADAGVNALHVDLQAAEPFDDMTGPMGEPIAERTLGDAPETMPRIRIQVEPVVVEVSKPTLPPIPDQYIVQHFKQSGDFSYWWTSILVHETLEAAQEFAQGKVAARIVKIPGGAA